MVHIDVKKVGRIPDGGGWRAHGRGTDQAKAADRSKRSTKRGGYVYLHSAIDGYSRLAYTEALPDEKAATAVAFMHRARAWFTAHGIAHIERIVTDNGACYRAEAFTRALLGSRHQRITPYTPRHNGKMERYNRIISEEFLTPVPGPQKTNAAKRSKSGTSITTTTDLTAQPMENHQRRGYAKVSAMSWPPTTRRTANTRNSGIRESRIPGI